MRSVVLASALAFLRAPVASLCVATLAAAPFQCAREPDPARAIEEGPDEALYALAERFRERGDQGARAATLRFLVERYPSSRFAGRARQELLELGMPPPP